MKKNNYKHQEAFRFLDFQNKAGTTLRIFNPKDRKIPFKIKVSGVEYVMINFKVEDGKVIFDSPQVPDYKLQPNDYFFGNFKEEQITELVEINIKMVNEQLLAQGKGLLSRTERRNYEKQLKTQYSFIPVVMQYTPKNKQANLD